MSKREAHGLNTLAAILSVCVIVVVGCLTGHDGWLLKIGIAAISGLGGFSLGRYFPDTSKSAD